MRQHDSSRTTRQAIGAVVVAISAALLPASAMAVGSGGGTTASPPHATLAKGETRVVGFDHSNLTIKAGRKIADSVVVVPHARRVVLVQAKRPGGSHFVTLSSGRSAASGAFRAVYVATQAGDWQFRLAVRPTPTRQGTVTEPRSVRAVDLTAPGAVAVVATAATTSTVALTWVNPKDKDFSGVTIRRAVGLHAPRSPNAGTGVADTGRRATTFTDSGLAADTAYSYALFAHDRSSNFTRATIAVRTQRDGVTGLGFTAVSRTSVALAWTNPVDDRFSGVTIRRADGPTPPASATDGTFVAEVGSPESTYVDTGLTPDTQYSYAVFAHDAEHVALGATLTVSTRAPGTDAVLRVNPLHPTGDKVTVGSEIAFDGTDSLAADGTTITAWSIDYGDGSTETFSAGPLDPVDLNTSHVYTATGTRTVTLTVTDSDNNTATDTITLNVFSAPEVTVSVKTIAPNGDVTFDITAVTPPGTAITSWQMDVSGDDVFFLPDLGTPAGPPPPTMTVAFAPGAYTIDFEITNDAGASVFAVPVDLVVP
jgi:hypothetical protein